MTTEMNGKELLLRALRNETTPRPAWLPFVGSHGARMIGVSAADYLQSADLIEKGLLKAAELYRPDGLPVCFDLQVEAEALGCELKWPDDGPPSVTSHPLEGGRTKLEDLPEFTAESGRMPVVLEATRRVREKLGDSVALYGLICGPFTLTLHLLGNDIFLEMFDSPLRVRTIVAYAAEVAKRAAEAYIEAGVDVVAVVDPMTSQISPEHFEEFVTPYVNMVFDHVRNKGAYSSLFVCGDATRNLHVMARTSCDNLSIDENIPLETLRDITRATGKSFGGNLKLTAALLLGDTDDCQLDAIRCIDVGGSCGFILAPGCDLPFGTPEENLVAVAEMVHDDYKREVAKRTIVAKTASHAGEVALPDYDADERVHVDVITLDSASCAPCQYMMDAAHRASKRLETPVVIAEHRITTREGIAMMSRLGVSNIPTICIDGEPKFVSIIPDQNTLVQAIQARAEEKRG